MTATFVYDADCGFCSWWAELFAERTDLGIVGFAQLTDAERERLPEDWEECAHLLTEEAVYSCGAAIERALLRTDVLPPAVAEAVAFLRGFEDYERLRERAYRAGADRRSTLGDFVSADPPARREPGDERWEDERSESSERPSGRRPRGSESPNERAGDDRELGSGGETGASGASDETDDSDASGEPDEPDETDSVDASGEDSAADDGGGEEGTSSDSGATDESGN